MDAKLPQLNLQLKDEYFGHAILESTILTYLNTTAMNKTLVELFAKVLEVDESEILNKYKEHVNTTWTDLKARLAKYGDLGDASSSPKS